MKTFLPTEVAPTQLNDSIEFIVTCRCGLVIERIPDRKQAEVIADQHEATARVAHKHDTVIGSLAVRG